MSNFIQGNYHNSGKLFTYVDFRNFAVKAFLEKHKNEEAKSIFKRFDHFIGDFKEKAHISSRTAHPKRGSAADLKKRNIHSEQGIEHLLSTFPRDRILNCNETSWHVFSNSLKI